MTRQTDRHQFQKQFSPGGVIEPWFQIDQSKHLRVKSPESIIWMDAHTPKTGK